MSDNNISFCCTSVIVHNYKNQIKYYNNNVLLKEITFSKNTFMFTACLNLKQISN